MQFIFWITSKMVNISFGTLCYTKENILDETDFFSNAGTYIINLNIKKCMIFPFWKTIFSILWCQIIFVLLFNGVNYLLYLYLCSKYCEKWFITSQKQCMIFISLYNVLSIYHKFSNTWLRNSSKLKCSMFSLPLFWYNTYICNSEKHVHFCKSILIFIFMGEVNTTFDYEWSSWEIVITKHWNTGSTN